MLAKCEFETDRLSVEEWRASSAEDEAGAVLLTHISDDARPFLPLSMASIRTTEEAIKWLGQQDGEGAVVLFARLIPSNQVASVLIVYERDDTDPPHLYIGYLVSPKHRGNGIATELVQGLVKWVGDSTSIGLLVAGVESANVASVAVLTKSGFVPKQGTDASDGYNMYELRLKR